uniref:Putative secreted protein n=1 Tax=Xenopsylla cheopis TaxID=163159 RepID=A0A6M2DWT0_XENCH
MCRMIAIRKILVSALFIRQRLCMYLMHNLWLHVLSKHQKLMWIRVVLLTESTANVLISYRLMNTLYMYEY